MNTTLKNLIYSETKALFEKLHGPDFAVQGACLYWARCGIMTLLEHDITPCLQAGTLLWKFVPDNEDDGFLPTHFGFQWAPNDPQSRIQMIKGLLPEMHIWCACVATQEIIDFSTGYISQIARQRGFNWRTPEPPEFLWCHIREVPECAHYESNRDATLLAMEFLLKANCVEEMKREEVIEV